MSLNPSAAPSTQQPQDRMRDMMARVQDRCDLPPLPAVSARALQLIREPSTTAESMAKLIATDATLAARVLHLSRSPLYLRRVAPTTLRDAILTVGFAGLRQILLAASVRSIFKIEKAAAQRLWEHALATALAAEELRKAEADRSGSDAFLAGLIHDIGRQVLFLADPARAAAIGGEDLGEETRVFGIDHVQVGACLAQKWGFDEAVVTAVLTHHDEAPEGLGRRIARADVIADALGYRVTELSAEGQARIEAEPAPLDPTMTECAERVRAEFELQKSLFN